MTAHLMDTVTDAADATAVSSTEATSAMLLSQLNATARVDAIRPEIALISRSRPERGVTSPETQLESKMADVTSMLSASPMRKRFLFLCLE